MKINIKLMHAIRGLVALLKNWQWNLLITGSTDALNLFFVYNIYIFIIIKQKNSDLYDGLYKV